MTPTFQQQTFMQVETAKRTKSHIRLIASDIEPEQPLNQANSIEEDAFQTLPSRTQHQRVHSLILGARQVHHNGSISGQTLPYLPNAPSLYRDYSDEKEYKLPYQPSPLHNLAFGSTLPRPQKLLVSRDGIAYTSYQPTRMPHAVTVQTGFQALILCGPGIGLSTFTNVPHDYPKALVPIANRPMIWYVLDWCYRMGVTNITIITPPASKAPLEAALGQHPDLTSLPSPKPDLLAPADLEFNTPTAELLRLPEVQQVITSDFLLLPCDLICEVPGDALLETYLTSMAGMAGTRGADHAAHMKSRTSFAAGAEGSGRRGGLSIWYNTSNRDESVKKEECDFMGSVTLDNHHEQPIERTIGLPSGSLRKLVWTKPMSEMLDDAEENKSWRMRQSLMRRYGSVKCITKYRDAHLYFLPLWVKDFAMTNEDFESVSEDLVGTWAQAEWRKPQFRAQRGASKIFKQRKASMTNGDDAYVPTSELQDELDLLSLSSTQITRHSLNTSTPKQSELVQFASRVQNVNPEDSMISNTTDEATDGEDANDQDPSIPHLPPMLSYILPSSPAAPLVRRVDSAALVLSVSLLLAKLSDTSSGLSSGSSISPFSHQQKIHPTSQPPSDVRVNVNTADTLVSANTTLNQYCNIKQSCIGANCVIGTKARIQGCVVMDGAQIGESATLSGCIVGKKAKIGKGSILKDCEVQDGMVIGDSIEAKNEKFLIGGFEEGDDMDDEEQDDDQQ